MSNSIYSCNILELPKVENRAGNITAIENTIHVPFDVERVYYMYDVPGGEERGGHAHKKLQQMIVAVSGAFDVLVDDGITRKIVRLDRPYIGLHVISGIWREILNFSSGAICLVLASTVFDESDYIRSYQDFKHWKLTK